MLISLEFLVYEIEYPNGYPKFDFCYACAQSVFQKIPVFFRDIQDTENAKFLDTLHGGVPIGGVDFVGLYTKRVYKRELPPPRNVPESLWPKEFSGREIFEGDESEFRPGLMVKSATKIKGYKSIPLQGVKQCKPPKGRYQYSEVLDFNKIESEWRIFVRKDSVFKDRYYIVDARRYQGLWDSPPPDREVVMSMIEAFSSEAPVAYTLDVAVYGGKTVVVEVHDFYSIGMYGFDSYDLYAKMCLEWYDEFLNSNCLDFLDA